MPSTRAYQSRVASMSSAATRKCSMCETGMPNYIPREALPPRVYPPSISDLAGAAGHRSGDAGRIALPQTVASKLADSIEQFSTLLFLRGDLRVQRRDAPDSAHQRRLEQLG